MMKNTVLAVLFLAFVGLLIVGAVNRTLARADMTTGGGEPAVDGNHDHATAADDNQVHGQGGGGESRVEEWLTVEGVVASVDDSAMTFRTAASKDIMVEGRPWQFAIEQGFAPAIGDEVTVFGFHEGGEFKAGRIEDATSGQSITLRDESGRPGWAGQGRRSQEASPGN